MEKLICFSSKAVGRGGRYTAKQQENGKWTMMTVPIMAELSAGEKGNPQALRRKWLEAAIAQDKQNRSEKHDAPAHIGHHKDDGRDTPRIGFLELTHIGRVRHEGKDLDAIFANISDIAEEDLQLFEDMRFPYRSVEIRSFKKPEINSLAFLNNRSPHQKLPMITIGHKISNEQIVVQDMAGNQPALEFASVGDGGAFLFEFEHDFAQHPDDEKKFPPDQDAHDDEDHHDPEEDPEKDEQLQEKKDGNGNGNGPPPPPNANGNGDDDAAPTISGPSEGDQNIRQIMEVQNQMLGIIGALAEKLGIGPVMPPVQTPPVEQFEGDSKMDEKRFAQLEGTVSGLQKSQRTREKVDNISTLVGDAVGMLEGYDVDETMIESMRQTAEKSTDPKGTLKIWVDNHMANVPRETPGNLTEYDGIGDGSPGDPPEVAKFVNEGPEKAEKARQFNRQYNECTRHGLGTMSREDFILSQFESEAANTEAATV